MSCGAQRQKELEALGWTMQFTAEEPRLSEAVEDYRELGFEVHLEAVNPTACSREGGCSACFQDPEFAGRLKVIFTRRAGASSGD